MNRVEWRRNKERWEEKDRKEYGEGEEEVEMNQGEWRRNKEGRER